MSTLSGLKVAILVADGFEQVEMTEPRKALQEAGADTQIVSPACAWNGRVYSVYSPKLPTATSLSVAVWSLRSTPTSPPGLSAVANSRRV